MRSRIAAAVALAAFIVTPAVGRIDVTLDADSLNSLIATMAPDHVDVELTGGRSITLQLKDLKVTGFDPAAGSNGGVTTALRLVVPDLGIDMPVTPRLTLQIDAARKTSYLRFDRVILNLPIGGAVDVASLLPPLALMPDTAWVIDSARGRMRVKPELIDARTGAKNIRLGFDLNVRPAGP